MRQWLASWEGFSIHPERFVDAGDRVIALVILRARARASGAPLEQSGANVHFFRDGRMSRLEIYPNRDAPLRAVGLAPDSA